MIGGLAPSLQDLPASTFVHGNSGQHVRKHILGNQPRATASDQNAAGFQKAKSRNMQPSIAAERFLNGIAGAGELRRIEHDKAKAFPGLAMNLQILDDLPALEMRVGDPVEFGIRAREGNGRFGHVNTEDFRSAGASGMQSKSARITKSVQNPAVFGVAGNRSPIVPLVEIETGFFGLRQGSHGNEGRLR